jgi:hypothetical protein
MWYYLEGHTRKKAPHVHTLPERVVRLFYGSVNESVLPHTSFLFCNLYDAVGVT